MKGKYSFSFLNIWSFLKGSSNIISLNWITLKWSFIINLSVKWVDFECLKCQFIGILHETFPLEPPDSGGDNFFVAREQGRQMINLRTELILFLIESPCPGFEMHLDNFLQRESFSESSSIIALCFSAPESESSALAGGSTSHTIWSK